MSAAAAARSGPRLGRLAGGSLAALRSLGAGALLLGEALAALVRPPYAVREFVGQCLEVGVRSIPVVVITGGFTGMVLAYQSAIAFARFGAEELIGTVVALSMVRELGPVLTGAMVAGRVGSAMAAELGSMRVTEQIDAMLTLGVDPLRQLVVPRLLAATVMLPALVVFASAIGILGGGLVAVQVLGANPTVYEARSLQYLALPDVHVGLLKAAVFGATLALVSCHQGYSVKGGAREVGRAVTRAVVASLVLILVFDYLLTAWCFG
jgi:phospholipid/cholesterol/gamma-HCH transport system permease protein